MIDTIAEARERLVSRARQEGLATVGYAVVDSAVGPLWVAVGPRGVTTIHYGSEPTPGELRRLLRVHGPGIVPDERAAAPVARQLDEYFEGKRRQFELSVDLDGLTEFQRRVLAATSRLGFGELATYATVARSAGNGLASRAAGAALGANPIPIVVPCHRVVASDGTLGGYAGGLAVKRRLLAIERGDDVPAGGWPPTRGRLA